MVRRALLIGSRTFGLRGCDADAEVFARTLADRGFDHLDVRTGPGASYDRLVEAFEALIDATRPGDAVVVYYSGHGARIPRPDHAERIAAGRSPYHRFLVPSDFGHGGFRGLFAEELSEFQRRLTEVSVRAGARPNVTTVLDCCHAGYLARDLGLRPKALSPKDFQLTGIEQRLERPAAEPPAGGSDSNPYAIRVVAAQEEQSAFEAETAHGPRGLLTEALVTVLGGLGDRPVSWSVLGDLVRRRVQDVVLEQRPDVEGPVTLLPFSEHHGPGRAGLPVGLRDGEPVIEPAGLLGIAAGDRFRLASATGPLGEARVDAVLDGVAHLHRAGGPAITPDTYAVPLRANTRRPVSIRVGGATGAVLRDLVAAAPRLVVADGPAFASVVDDDGLRVLDDLGARLRTDPLDARGAVDLLDLVARARTLIELGSGDGDATLTDPVDVSFAVVGETGGRVGQPASGARLRPGDRVSVRLRNLGTRPLYFWLFDIGVSARISLVTNAAPRGTRLGRGGELDDTRTVWGASGGPLSWPPDVPRWETGGPAARLETFVVVLADRPQDLRPLETSRGVVSGPALSGLDAVLDAVRPGAREVPSESGAPERRPLRYRVARIQFLVDPA